MSKLPSGTVYLIGAGPGDPGLMTVRGLELIRRADCIIYDYLANEAFLLEASSQAEIIYVGKKGGDHTLPQKDINQLLVDKARERKVIVRLKGGDPYIFGRGGEEAQELIRHGIPFEEIPGITSAIAVPAYAGIPLTHRLHASLVSLITGHEDPLKPESAIPWEVLAKSPGTLVFLMGVKNLADICRELRSRGKPADTPAAVIHRGTTPAQRTVVGTLTDIAQKVQEAGLAPPAIFVVGSVVELRPELNWFETRPLWGKRILVTRSRHQASAFVKLLTEYGATCLEAPTLDILLPDDGYAGLDEALKSLDRYHWIIFTSPNGVEAFFNRLFQSGQDVRALGECKLAVIGAATAQSLREHGLVADVVPADFRAEGLVASLSPLIQPGQLLLLPRAQDAREVLPEEMANRGAIVHVVPSYKTALPAALPPATAAALQQGVLDVLTFASSSTVTNFARLLGREHFQKLAAKSVIAAIGPITAQTVEKFGLRVHIQPRTYTIPALTEAIVDYFQTQKT
jgi:uroporphyrinogen III methyltransferase / synthase